MNSDNKFYNYLKDGISFESKQAAALRKIYMPLSGNDATSLKSAITPYLAGDSKIDKFTYLTKPTSTEDLRNNGRDFFCFINSKEVIGLAQENEEATVTVGPLWHKLTKNFKSVGLTLESTNFIPSTGENVELMRVFVRNTGDKTCTFVPTSSIPLFARALDNKHDHEHVTSLLHRTEQWSEGVYVQPPMTFNEEGHTANDLGYFVLGCDSKGSSPLGSFPTFDSFLGEASTFQKPQAVYANEAPKTLTDHEIQGKEAVGALRFDEVTLKAGEEISYVIMMGIVESSDEAHAIFKKFNTLDQFEQALILTHKYWNDKAHAIDFRTGDSDFDAWMQWVTIQPVLRRIFGCSFLPDHDYGKGGKGWRDIWQDLLALILIEPATVRDVLINNFAGVRLDGSNATIIGARPGEFVADRNAITRVWMDHGAWPYSTTLLYVDQTGDFDILFERNTYFRDQQLSRSYKKDDTWNSAYGNDLKDTKGNVYEGTLLEHILVQHLVQFFNVGEHNIVRLESADWNDGLDMGFDRGESVTFASYYAGNLLSIAELLERLKEIKGTKTITLLKELSHLLDRVTGKAVDYSSIEDKKNRLFKDYCNSVQPEISGVTVDIEIDSLISDLKEKGQWLFKHIKEQEKISVDGDVWYNGYYDNKGMRVEGKKDGNVWMTLTGQVFPIMSGLATDDEVAQIIQSANKYLRDENLGGYRLNSDFGVRHYLDLGRAFGFAFGTKENGAFFSHMIVMYGYALYSRGFVRAGYEVLSSIYNMCMDVDKSQIYPGIPEYFDATGRGMYHYLTGSASWMVLAQQVQVFGVRGSGGDLVISPKLVKEQFSDEGIVSITSQFASKTIKVVYRNTDKLDYGAYGIDSVTLNGKAVDCEAIDKSSVKIARAIIKASSDTTEILVNLKSPEFN